MYYLCEKYDTKGEYLGKTVEEKSEVMGESNPFKDHFLLSLLQFFRLK